MIKHFNDSEIVVSFSRDNFSVYYDVFKQTYCLVDSELNCIIDIKESIAKEMKRKWWKMVWEFDLLDCL